MIILSFTDFDFKEERGDGDTVTAATRYRDLDDINYIWTAGGAVVRYLSGKKNYL